MDITNALFVVLVILTSLVTADLLLAAVLSLLDLLDPGQVRSGFAQLGRRLIDRFHEPSEPGAQAKRSSG